MDIIYVNEKIVINWTICRNASEVLEDFTKADLRVFLIGNDFDGNYDGKYYFGNELDAEGRVVTTIEAGSLTPGTYCIEALWIKNRHELDKFSTRTLSRARKDRIFKVVEAPEDFSDSSSYYESSSYDENPNPAIHEINIKTGVTSYGYDGMSAYETAVFEYSTKLSEQEWIERYQQAEDRINYEMEEDTPGTWANAEKIRKENEGIGTNPEDCADGSRRKNEYVRQQNESERQAAEAERQITFETNEGTEQGSVAGDHSRWGDYKQAELDRGTSYVNAEGTNASPASNNNRWGQYRTAENSRQEAYTNAEGTSSDEPQASNRWGAYKRAEGSLEDSEKGDSDRWGQYKEQEGTPESTSDDSRWAEYNTAEAGRNTSYGTAEGAATDAASSTGSRWARYKYAENTRGAAYDTAEGEATDASSATGSRWARFNKAQDDRTAAYSTAEAARTAAMGPIMGYYSCATAASTAAKEVSATNYVLTSGGSIKVKFTYANSASSPTLNINSTGAKAIVYNGAVASATNTWAAGDVVEFYYDPTYNSNAGAFVGIPTVVSVSQNTLSIGGNYAGEMSTTYDVTLHSGQTFASLSALLSDANLNTLIPLVVRKGGMSIKFVCSSDNKYVQYRLMSDTFSITPANWQGITSELKAGSKDLVESGGVLEAIENYSEKIICRKTIAVSDTQQDLYVKESDWGKKVAIRIVASTATLTRAPICQVRDSNNSETVDLTNDYTFIEKENDINRIYIYVAANSCSVAGYIQIEIIYGNAYNTINVVSVTKNTTTGDDSFNWGSNHLANVADADKLIELIAITHNARPSGTLQIGDIYYIESSNKLYRYIGGSPDTEEVPLYKSAMYVCNNELYLWNGSTLINKTEADDEPVWGSNKLAKSKCVFNIEKQLGVSSVVTCPITFGQWSDRELIIEADKDMSFTYDATGVVSGGTIYLYIFKDSGTTTASKSIINNQNYPSIRALFDNYEGKIYGLQLYLTSTSGNGDTTLSVTFKGLKDELHYDYVTCSSSQSLTTQQKEQFLNNIGINISKSAELGSNALVKSSGIALDRAKALGNDVPITIGMSAGGEGGNRDYYIEADEDASFTLDAASVVSANSSINFYIYTSDGNTRISKAVVNKQQYNSIRELFGFFGGKIYGFFVYITNPSQAGNALLTLNFLTKTDDLSDSMAYSQRLGGGRTYGRIEIKDTIHHIEPSSKIPMKIKAGSYITLTTQTTCVTNSFSYYLYYADGIRSNAAPVVLNGTTSAIYIDKDVEYIGFYIENTKISSAGVVTFYVEFQPKFKMLEELPEYYKADNYIQNKIDVIRQKMFAADGEFDAFVFITDIHWPRNTKKSPAIISYLQDKFPIPRMLMGGDYADGIDIRYLNAYNDFRGNIYRAIGNHEYMDYWRESDDSYLVSKTVTDATIWAMYQSGMKDIVIGDANTNYYYADNTVQKIRYIFLSVFTNESAYKFEQVQQDWLDATINNMPSGYLAVVVAHQVLYDKNAHFDATPASWETDFVSAIGTPIATICDRYIGRVACILGGHTHLDLMDATTGGIPVFETTCDKAIADQDETTARADYIYGKREVGTITEQAFDVVVINKKDRLVSLVRIGAPADNEGGTELQIREQYYPTLPS